jgi:hypothetical protein
MDGARELRSWKEIAAHFGDVSVRTVQKWEKERGLPVRRLPGKRGRVVISLADLERWKHQPTTLTPERCYRVPLSANVTAELRFAGDIPTAQHIEVLIEYLTVAKHALRPGERTGGESAARSSISCA